MEHRRYVVDFGHLAIDKMCGTDARILGVNERWAYDFHTFCPYSEQFPISGESMQRHYFVINNFAAIFTAYGTIIPFFPRGFQHFAAVSFC